MIELQSQDALRAAHARLTRIADKLTDFPALHRRAGGTPAPPNTDSASWLFTAVSGSRARSRRGTPGGRSP